MKHARLLTAGLLFLIPLGVVACRDHDAVIWRDLTLIVPGSPLAATAVTITNGIVSARLSDGHDEVGHLQLPSGDVWRFAFRSHHLIGGPESYTVLVGPLGSYRIRGDYFCCEVQFPRDATPKTSDELLSLLRTVNTSVERIR